jgi:valyl-tRNA synthetase
MSIHCRVLSNVLKLVNEFMPFLTNEIRSIDQTVDHSPL